MAEFIPEEVIQQIQNRSDIVETISGYIPLRRSGNSFKAVCPFHNEKTPSFMVNPARQIWHCFGCGLGGNVFNFIMKHEKLEFPDVVRLLAEKTGVEIPSSFRGPADGRSKAKRLYRINELSARYFHNNLIDENKGKSARRYLSKRGVDLETIRKFRLGFALDQWNGLLNFAKKQGEKEDLLKLAGLVIARKERGYYDHFRNRLIFPIFDLQDRVLAFGGRVLDQNLPKYINSPQNPLFNKGRCLYGLNLAKQALKGKGYFIIVEGYMDVITLYRLGVRNVVATLGTALTIEHAKLLKRYVSSVAMVYDADQAGETASLRGLEVLLEEGLEIKVVRLAGGFDPDSFIIAKGKENFEKTVVTGQGLFDYKLGLLTNKYNPERLEEIAKITAEMLPTIARIDNAVLKSGYIRKLARALSIDEGSLLIELKKIKRKDSFYCQSQENPVPKYNFSMNAKEKTLVSLMLEDPETAGLARDNLALEDFRDLRLRQIAAVMFKMVSEKKKYTSSQIINHLKDEQASQLISGLSAGPEQVGSKQRISRDCIKKIKAESLKQARLNLQKKIKVAEEARDDKEQMRLLGELNSLIRV